QLAIANRQSLLSLFLERIACGRFVVMRNRVEQRSHQQSAIRNRQSAIGNRQSAIDRVCSKA
ncbi:MAG: hypothetical protein ABR568_24035, partial [Pyrinomonadaceae bacterium]